MKTEVKQQIAALIKSMKTKSLDLTAWVPLKNDGDKEWALVLAWCDGFDVEKDPNEFQYEEYRICGKVAYNDIYAKEYDTGWIMPLDKNGQVYDSEVSINSADDINEVIQFWENCWEEIDNMYSITKDKYEENIEL